MSRKQQQQAEGQGEDSGKGELAASPRRRLSMASAVEGRVDEESIDLEEAVKGRVDADAGQLSPPAPEVRSAVRVEAEGLNGGRCVGQEDDPLEGLEGLAGTLRGLEI